MNLRIDAGERIACAARADRGSDVGRRSDRSSTGQRGAGQVFGHDLAQIDHAASDEVCARRTLVWEPAIRLRSHRWTSTVSRMWRCSRGLPELLSWTMQCARRARRLPVSESTPGGSPAAASLSEGAPARRPCRSVAPRACVGHCRRADRRARRGRADQVYDFLPRACRRTGAAPVSRSRRRSAPSG